MLIWGRSEYQEAIHALNLARPMEPLEWSDGMAMAARDHCLDIGFAGLTGSTGSLGQTLE